MRNTHRRIWIGIWVLGICIVLCGIAGVVWAGGPDLSATPTPVPWIAHQGRPESAIREFLQSVVTIQRTDNDISTTRARTGKRVTLPPEVIDRLQVEMLKLYHEYYLEQLADSSLAHFYGPVIYRIRCPDDKYLYKFTFDGPPGVIEYHFLLFDPHTRHTSPQTLRIPAQAMDNNEAGLRNKLLRKPYVAFDDMNQDGQPELVVHRRGHNGTTNWAEYLYYDLTEDLSFTLILELETRILDGMEIEKSIHYTVLRVKKLQPNQLRIIVERVNIATGEVVQKHGELMLEAPDAASAFRLKQTVCSAEFSDCSIFFTPVDAK